MFRAFYKPANGTTAETYVDAEKQNQLPAGAILIIKFNKDGTREIVEDAKKTRSLTPKEAKYHDYAQRHLQFKYDGGDTPEFYEENKLRAS